MKKWGFLVAGGCVNAFGGMFIAMEHFLNRQAVGTFGGILIIVAGFLIFLCGIEQGMGLNEKVDRN